MTNKIHFYLGADHAGFALKQELLDMLRHDGRAVKDLSPTYRAGDDYPQAAKRVAKEVRKDPRSLGVLVCGTGHGMEMAANRFKGIRAFVARTEEDAKLAREHNHANVIVFGGWVTKPAVAKKILRVWMKAKPSSAARHKRRVRELDT